MSECKGQHIHLTQVKLHKLPGALYCIEGYTSVVRMLKEVRSKDSLKNLEQMPGCREEVSWILQIS